jgi:transposase
VLLVGIDWAERHHDVCVMAADGSVLARERITDGVAGLARLHELIASWAEEPAEVVVGIETDRGLLVGALVAAGYQVVAVNPLAASRYRERHTISRAKSDRGDARMLADLVRTDRHHHRRVAGDTGLVEAVKVLARGHQQLVWARQRQANLVRSALRGFYPAALAAFGGDPGGRDAVAVLGLAPTPDRGRALSHAELVEALRRAGRRRQVDARAVAIRAVLVSQQLEAPAVVAGAYGQVVTAAVAVIASLSEQLAGLEAALAAAFTAHPDAAIVRSQPGLGMVLAARVLAEFGDDPNRYANAKARKAYAGTAPITRASGLRQVVLARAVGNRRLTTA